MGILPMISHGRDACATLFETFQRGHGGVEKDAVIVEARAPQARASYCGGSGHTTR